MNNLEIQAKPQSLVLSFILFTLKDKKVDDNMYIAMLLSCWNTLYLYGNLQKGDSFFLTIDTPTFEHIKRDSLFNSLYTKLKAKGLQLDFNVLDQPKTLLEGFLWKYHICAYNPVLKEGKAQIYIDADTVCLRPLDRLRTLLYEKEGFILCPEGLLTNGNYSDVAFPAPLLEKLKSFPGVSAGLFAFRLSTANIEKFSTLLKTRLRECNFQPAGYCIEQPYFNYVAWSMIVQTNSLLLYSLKLNKDILLNSFAIDSAPEAIFLNLAGEPGNSTPHAAKWLSISQILLDRAVTSRQAND